AIIRPAADVFDPKVVRATMGAVFSLRVKQYDDFDAYRAEHSGRALYPFMLDGAVLLEQAVQEAQAPFSLIFGNEGSGLPPEFGLLGQAVRIPHNDQIDSLNLAIAVGIGAYAFMRRQG
ncbi:MAG: TrmH family RNA methyltransferase, partial [Clostridia bacterium]